MSSLLSLSQRYISLAIGNKLNVFCRNTGKLLFEYECNGKDKKNVLITHIKYSSKHDCFIIVTDDKYITSIVNKDKIYQIKSEKKMDKKVSSICLSPPIINETKKKEEEEKQEDEYLITADKFGVIYIQYLPSLKIKYDGTGHLSIISHITFDSSGKYLMSCDKDFKIRISRFPQIYIIDAFCYGHTKAVTKCVTINDKYILSTSIDKTIRIWSIPNGKQLSVFKVKKFLF